MIMTYADRLTKIYDQLNEIETEINDDPAVFDSFKEQAAFTLNAFSVLLIKARIEDRS